MVTVETVSILTLVAFLIGDRIVGYFKTRGIDLVKIAKTFEEVDFRKWEARDQELYGWHDHEDPEQAGVKIWWNQKYVSSTIRQLGDIQVRQTELIKELHDGNKAMVRLMEIMDRKLDLIAKKGHE